MPYPDLWVFFASEGDASGTVGRAWTGGICRYARYHQGRPQKSEIKKLLSLQPFLLFMLSDPYLQSCVNEYFVDSVRTGNVVAHEIGHNLGIGHDFVSIDENNNKENRTCDTDGSVCTDQGGVMDYYVTVTGWTCCSVDDWNKEITEFPVYCLRSADGTRLFAFVFIALAIIFFSLRYLADM